MKTDYQKIRIEEDVEKSKIQQRILELKNQRGMPYTMNIEIQNALNHFGFAPSLEENNLYYRLAEDDNHDVIRYLPDDDCYNLCTADGCHDFINESLLLGILKNGVIGKLAYGGMLGEDEVMKYTDKEKYLTAIKRELFYNPDGFRAITISKDPELRKQVDDLYYGNCCADNPHPIEYYQEIIDKEIKQSSKPSSTLQELRRSIGSFQKQQPTQKLSL